jgi:disulfide bond formation protein DsbB
MSGYRLHAPLPVRHASLIILGAAAATIGGALVLQYGFGLTPCKLCLMQRHPYYLAMPLAFAAALAPRRLARLILVLLALIFLVSAGLGAYHAGVEWGFWLGPSDCGGAGAAPSASQVGDFLNQLQTTRVISCTEAAWRFLGLSLAGWNVLISLGLAGLALRSAIGSRTNHKSLAPATRP